MSRHLLDALLHHGRTQPDTIALRCPTHPPLTWAQLVVWVNEVQQQIRGRAEALSQNGSGRESANLARIVHESCNAPFDVVIALGCIAAGAIEIPIDSRLPLVMRERVFDQCGGVRWDPSASHQPCLDNGFNVSWLELERCAQRVDTHQPSLVLWTSGTTDQPRGVMLSQHNLTSNAKAKLRAVPQRDDDRRLTLLSIAHSYARTCDLGTWLISGCSWTLDYGRAALDRIKSNSRPTMINCVPVLAREIATRLATGDDALGELAVLGCGGAALDPELFADLRRSGVEVIQGYGCTESSPVICSSSPGETAQGLVGRPIDGCEIQIEDRRLYVRGANVMLGYLDDPAATAAKIDRDGWLDTGDLVEQQADGQLRILGRADDVIVLSNGFKLHPIAVEQEIVRCHACDYAVVVYVDEQLIVAVQGETVDRDEIASTIEPLLPPNTRYRFEKIDPPLSMQRCELTAKRTIRRSGIRLRYT